MSRGKIPTCLWLKGLFALLALLAMALPAEAMEKQVVEDRLQAFFDQQGNDFAKEDQSLLIDGVAHEMAQMESPLAESVLDSVILNLQWGSLPNGPMTSRADPLVRKVARLKLLLSIRQCQAMAKRPIPPDAGTKLTRQLTVHINKWKAALNSKVRSGRAIHDQAAQDLLTYVRFCVSDPLQIAFKMELRPDAAQSLSDGALLIKIQMQGMPANAQVVQKQAYLAEVEYLLVLHLDSSMTHLDYVSVTKPDDYESTMAEYSQKRDQLPKLQNPKDEQMQRFNAIVAEQQRRDEEEKQKRQQELKDKQEQRKKDQEQPKPAEQAQPLSQG